MNDVAVGKVWHAGGQFIRDEYAELTKNLDRNTYNKAFAADQMNFRTDQRNGSGHEMNDWLMSCDYADDMMVQFG